MRAYAVKEIFYTLQGEGRNAGRAAVFCRFAGCNLWSGREQDRASAVCTFCDTDFVGTNGSLGGRYETAAKLASTIGSAWGAWGEGAGETPLVVLTGGEPLLQVDADLVDALHSVGFEIAVESNGTIDPPGGIDWLCISPKAGARLVVTRGDELKLVYPQTGAEPEAYVHLRFDNFLLQPMDGPEVEANTAAAIAYCMAHPRWRLTLQTHKMLGIR
ncbi:7-carboxy-7-deazaguanine synthase [Fulvimarina sp. 2208YS6-2-32]|uniref:7-carboxy-7-deazaguanine synthase n=1 Tax=Fulvimarina uroteuthidis TaxID=3098149 RepID=A0ABU5I3B1_9HYPH|nr:7-carboxy-7-deazaguanine synthase [Fulvimarina sp. 2208YS6-2-32]MDY8109837.1 7-carboxy-7-deazaguanine synthase [Fulvimarina sp. 2208YS6-2-32]